LGIGDWGLGPIPNPQSPMKEMHEIFILLNMISIIYKMMELSLFNCNVFIFACSAIGFLYGLLNLCFVTNFKVEHPEDKEDLEKLSITELDRARLKTLKEVGDAIEKVLS
jgi:hypothetical protein